MEKKLSVPEMEYVVRQWDWGTAEKPVFSYDPEEGRVYLRASKHYGSGVDDFFGSGLAWAILDYTTTAQGGTMFDFSVFPSEIDKEIQAIVVTMHDRKCKAEEHIFVRGGRCIYCGLTPEEVYQK